MGIFSNNKKIDKNINNNDLETRSGDNNQQSINDTVFGMSLPYNSFSWNQNMATKLSTVYRCIEVISNSVAQLPLEPYLVKGNNKIKYLEHNTYNLLNKNPNRRMTRYTFIKLIITSMLLKGNAYAYIKRDNRGNPIEIIYIPSELVTIVLPTSQADLFSDIKYSVVGFEKQLEYTDLLHFLNYTYDGVNGISTIYNAYLTLKLAMNSEEAASGFFEGGGNLSGILTVDTPLNAKQRDDIRNSWRNTFTGSNNNGVAILERNMHFQPITVSPSDAQLLESREFNVIEICRFFGVSPVIAFDYTKSNYSTVEATQLGFLTETLSPILEKIELEIERKLYKPSEQDSIDVKFDVNKLLRADIKSQAEYYSKMFNIGVMSINDIRNELNMPLIGEQGNKYYVQVNMQDINKSDNLINNLKDD